VVKGKLREVIYPTVPRFRPLGKEIFLKNTHPPSIVNISIRSVMVKAVNIGLNIFKGMSMAAVVTTT